MWLGSLSKVTGGSLVSILISCSSSEIWSATQYRKSSESSSYQGHAISDFDSGAVVKALQFDIRIHLSDQILACRGI